MKRSKHISIEQVIDALLPFIAVLLAMIVGAFILLLLDTNPLEAYKAMIFGAFGTKNGLADTLGTLQDVAVLEAPG